jgi:hypothetical protein
VLGVWALLAACAWAAPLPDTGVEGKVSIGPMCPVVQIGAECPDSPYAALLIVEDDRGRQAARIESAADGSFRVALPAGDYRLVPQPGESGMPWAEETPFTVVAGMWTQVDVLYDSGIR